MKHRFRFFGSGVAALVVLQFCPTVAAQEFEGNVLGLNEKTSQASKTGASAGSSRTTIAASGGAGGSGNSLLGGERRPLYRLCTIDVVDVSFTLSPEFNQTLTVQPDGYVALKDADMVYAQGLTLEEFSKAVREAYRGYLHDPQVAVALKEFEHPYFIAGGEVGKPGKYELRSDTTVAEAVEIAGGFTQQAKHSQVVLFRRVNDEVMEARLINLKKMLKDKNLGEDPHLRPGDFVFVPQNAISKIARFLTKPSMSMYMNSSQF